MALAACPWWSLDARIVKYGARNASWIRLLLLALFTAQAAVVILLRFGWRPGIDLVRGFNKRILNPVMIRVAGRRYWYAAALHHIGTRSGRGYTTPVVAERIGDRVYIPLPDGRDVYWCRNLEAAGWGELELGGVRYGLSEPGIVPADEVAPLLPPRRLRTLNVFRVREFLSLETAPWPHAS